MWLIAFVVIIVIIDNRYCRITIDNWWLPFFFSRRLDESSRVLGLLQSFRNSCRRSQTNSWPQRHKIVVCHQRLAASPRQWVRTRARTLVCYDSFSLRVSARHFRSEPQVPLALVDLISLEQIWRYILACLDFVHRLRCLRNVIAPIVYLPVCNYHWLKNLNVIVFYCFSALILHYFCIGHVPKYPNTITMIVYWFWYLWFESAYFIHIIRV